MAKSLRRGLSPLVATVVLISATVIGGLVIYNYFEKSINVVSTASATLSLYVDETYLNTDTKLVYIQAVNLYDKPVNVTGVTVVMPDGSTVNLQADDVQGIPVTIEPGSKATIIAKAPADAAAVYLTYTVDGKTLTTEPQELG